MISGDDEPLVYGISTIISGENVGFSSALISLIYGH
jgi:hypothetical protein